MLNLIPGLIVICMITTGAAFGQVTKEVNRTIPFETSGKVSIDTYKGRVAILAWDKPELGIFARIEPDQGTTEEAINNTEIRIDSSRGFVQIKSDYSKLKEQRGNFLIRLFHPHPEPPPLPFVNYSIKVPHNVQLIIKDYKSQITVQNLNADVNIDTYKGSVDVTGSKGFVRVASYKGATRIEFSALEGKSNLSTYKGVIELVIPKESRFDLDCVLGKGAELHSEFDLKTSSGADESEKEYRISINGGGVPVYVKSEKGEVRLLQR